MIFYQAFFGKIPKIFQAINIDFSGSEVFTMINLKVAVTTEYQRIIAVKSIGINNASAANLLDGHV